MDFLQFHPTYRVLICTSCKYALVPNTIASHLRTAHKGQLTPTDIKDYLPIISAMCLEAPELVQQMVIPPSTPPVPHLTLYLDGIMCRLCVSRPYVCRTKGKMRLHLKEMHTWTSGERGGRPSKASQAARAASDTSFSKVTTSPVACQTFYRSNFFRYFVVQPVIDSRPAGPVADLGDNAANLIPLSLEDQITLQLAQKLRATEPSIIPGHDRHYTQVSPWLDTTQWTRYTRGHDLHQPARLIRLPDCHRPAGSAATQTTGIYLADHHLPVILESFTLD
jgi:hypothetical protein